MISVYYHFLKNKKVNGTLFYCFEYFEFLNRFEDTYFYIHKINEEDLEFVKNIFKERYEFDHTLLDKIIATDDIKSVYKSQSPKNLCLDIRTFDTIGPLIQGDFYVFVNGNNDQSEYVLTRSKMKNIKYYGSYEYQNFDEYNILKLNFDIFKKFDSPSESEQFESSGGMKNIRNKHSKKPSTFINIFEKYKTFKYIHNTMDTNNRFIPECFYYGRELEFVDECKIQDSSIFRYNDCKSGNLNKYRLDKDDKIIQDILNDNK